MATKKTRRNTHPNHKCLYSYGVRAHCSCGWQSDTWYGAGAKHEASKQFWTHRDMCEAEQQNMPASERIARDYIKGKIGEII